MDGCIFAEAPGSMLSCSRRATLLRSYGSTAIWFDRIAIHFISGDACFYYATDRHIGYSSSSFEECCNARPAPELLLNCDKIR